MTTAQRTTLHDQPVPVRAKLAAAWTSIVLLYAYVDILNFYKPGTVTDILVGKVYVFDITETWAVTALAMLAMPILMVALSTILPARASRVTNLAAASIQIPFAAFNLAGGEWTSFYGLGVGLELVLLVLVLRYAWTWPRTAPSASLSTGGAVPARQQA